MIIGKNNIMQKIIRFCGCFMFVLMLGIYPVGAQTSGDGDGIIEPGENLEEELAKAAQNPVANLISVPFQNNIGYDVGSRDKTNNVLNVQPVLPFNLSDEWNLITRTIAPIIYQPKGAVGRGSEFGLGDINFTSWLVPANPGKLIWGVGPSFLLPTASNNKLGREKWGVGPSVVFILMPNPWVLGILGNNIWSVAGDNDRDHINEMMVNPFINYNLAGGLYLVSSPVITANWKSDRSGDRWTVPVGGGIGKVWRLGKLPINTNIQSYYNVAKTDFGPRWTLRLQVQFMFPK
jgi:hypothetical protein